MNTMQSDPFNIGSTLSTPIRSDGKGSFATVSGLDLLHESLTNLITLKKGEMVMHPALGIDASCFLFNADTKDLADQMTEFIVRGLDGSESFVPGQEIEFDSLTVTVHDPDVSLRKRPITIDYVLKRDPEKVSRRFDTSIELER